MKSSIKQILLTSFFGLSLLVTTNANAINSQCTNAAVGMWFNADGTCSTEETSTTIGLIYWVLNGNPKVFNVMSLDQWENTASWDEAMTNCASYTTTGTSAGDWHLPTIAELIPMGLQYPCYGTSDNDCVSNGKFATLNAKLSTDLISSEYYWSSSRDYRITTNRNVARLSDGSLYNYYAPGTNYSGRCVLAF
ncbi:MAG: hypothetical protein R3Y43_03025 [Alphaproteobacteria bacterium]